MVQRAAVWGGGIFNDGTLVGSSTNSVVENVALILRGGIVNEGTDTLNGMPVAGNIPDNIAI